MGIRRHGWALAAAALLALAPARGAFAWGDRVHEAIVRMAFELLPEELRRALGLSLKTMLAASTEPDRRAETDPAEGPRQFIDIEMTSKEYLAAWRLKLASAGAMSEEEREKLRREFVRDYFTRRRPPVSPAAARTLFAALPREVDGFLAKVGIEGTSAIGTAPYSVARRYRELVGAMGTGDAGAISSAAGELSHYVADIHMPLHGTVNYKGQFTGNLIIDTEDVTRHCHVRYEVMVLTANVARLEADVRRRLVPSRAIPERAEPVRLAIDAAATAYPLGEVILRADRILIPGDEPPASWDEYIRRMYLATEEISIRQVARSAQMTADLIHTAWLEAEEAARRQRQSSPAAPGPKPSEREEPPTAGDAAALP